MQEYDAMRQLVQSIEEEVLKARGGNKAAGTRVRKAMQEVKDLAQDIRKKILEIRPEPESRPTGSEPTTQPSDN